MHTIIEKALNVDALTHVRMLVDASAFYDGRSTSTVVGKHNLQLADDSEAGAQAASLISDALLDHPLFQRAALPRRMLPLMFSKYEVGMSYPDHVDNAMMDGCRTDVATTIFLSDPESYDGGELVVDTGAGEFAFKLSAGDAIVYPATMLHRVAAVSRGVRLVAITWTQSLVRDAEKRKILFKLAGAVDDFPEGPCALGLRRGYHNLLRLWAES
jgi:PKHD-type hydroxylase